MFALNKAGETSFQKRQLTFISSMVTHAGKLQLVNLVLSSLPTYIMCSISVLVVVLFMRILIGQGDIACGGILILMQKLSLWLPEENALDQRRMGGLVIINL
jgi:hypothetical protein